MRIRSLLAAPIATAMLLLAACSGDNSASPPAGDAKPVQLSVVSAFGKDDPLMAGYWAFEENLKESAPWITLDYRGASEVMAPPQLGESVATGGIDMAATSATFHSQNVPLARALVMSPLTPAEEREKGVTKIMEDAHAQAGIRYIGRMSDAVPYKLYFKEKVDPLDLSGKSIRTSPVYVGLLEELGAGPVAMPAGEVYGAMERGVVAGYGWPVLGIMKGGWGDVTKFETSASFYNMDTIVIMNETKWKSLDENSQKAIQDAMIKTEGELTKLYGDMIEAEAKERAEAGIEVIEMDETATEEFVTKANEASWKAILSSSPDAEQLRDIYGN